VGRVAGPPPKEPLATREVQLQRDIVPILATSCSGEYCHGAAMTTAAGAYSYLVNQPALECEDGRVLVAPGRPDQSYLVDKVLQGHLCAGQPMPRGIENQLSGREIAMLVDWIQEGAPR